MPWLERLDERVIRCPGCGCWTFDRPHRDCVTDMQWATWCHEHKGDTRRDARA